MIIKKKIKVVRFKNEIIMKDLKINKRKNRLAKNSESQLNNQPNTSLKKIERIMDRIKIRLRLIDIRLYILTNQHIRKTSR